MNTNNVNDAHSAIIRQTLLLRACDLLDRIRADGNEGDKEDLNDLCHAYEALYGTRLPNQAARLFSGYE